MTATTEAASWVRDVRLDPGDASHLVHRAPGDGLGPVDLQRPAVIRGGATTWLRDDYWTAAGFAERSGHSEINVRVFVDGSTRDVCSFFVPLAEYVRYMHTGDASLLYEEARGSVGAAEQPPEKLRYFCASIDVPVLEESCAELLDLSILDHVTGTATLPEPMVQYWVGPRGSSIGLHRDGWFGYLVHLNGTKVATLLAPDQRGYLSLEYWDGIYSPVDVHADDFGGYPRFRHARYDRVVLEPGDVLFIPRWWFHDLRSVSEESTSVNVWFDLEDVDVGNRY